MLVSDDGALRYARDNAEVLWQVPVAVSVLAIYYAAIGVAISSLTSRRIIAGATIIGLLLISSIVSSVLVERRRGRPCERVRRDPPGPATIVTEDGDGDRGPERGRGRVRRRLRGASTRDPSAAALFNLLTLPLVVRDLVFLGEVEAGRRRCRASPTAACTRCWCTRAC